MKTILILVILLLAIVLLTYAQQRCFFTHYSTEDGLNLSIIQKNKKKKASSPEESFLGLLTLHYLLLYNSNISLFG